MRAAKVNLIIILGAVTLLTLVTIGLFSYFEKQPNEYYTLRVESGEQIEIRIRKQGEDTSILFTYGVYNIYFKKPGQDQSWDVFVSIRKMNLNTVPVYVKILDGDGVSVYSKVIMETQATLDFDEIL